MACDTDGRFAVGRRRGGTGLASHGGPSCQNPVERSAREVLLGPRWCPAGYGCRRLTSAVCWEYARKFVRGQALSQVTGSQSVVCKSIAKASKVRILLPGRVGGLSPASSSLAAKSGHGWHALAVAESHGDRTAHLKRSIPFSVCAGQGHNSIGPGSW